MAKRKGLTEAEVEIFETEGYVMIPDLFPPSALSPLRNEIAAIIDRSANRLFKEGKLSNLHADEPFETRLTRLMADHPELQKIFLKDIEGKGGGQHTGKEMFKIITHPRLLDAMENLVGSEIIASSVYRIRPKVPGLGRGLIPWHQDSGYFAPHCDNALIVTVWIPLVDATVENGCLYVLPRAHRSGVVKHKWGAPNGYLAVYDKDLPAPVSSSIPVPVPLGGALLLTNLTPHYSTTNYQDIVRWSIDLRYQAKSVPTNAFEMPEDFDESAPEITFACFPPEGDFIVRSAESPESVHTYRQFVNRRKKYENAELPGPNRGWAKWRKLS